MICWTEDFVRGLQKKNKYEARIRCLAERIFDEMQGERYSHAGLKLSDDALEHLGMERDLVRTRCFGSIFEEM